MACLENTLIDDVKFSEATYNDLRNHFAKWLETQVTEIVEGEKGEEICPPHPRYNNFLVVDDGVLQDMKPAPSLQTRYSKALKKSPYLKAVKAIHNAENKDRLAPRYSGRNNTHRGPLFPGSMKIPLIPGFWEVTCEYLDIVDIRPVKFEGEPCWDSEQEYLGQRWCGGTSERDFHLPRISTMQFRCKSALIPALVYKTSFAGSKTGYDMWIEIHFP